MKKSILIATAILTFGAMGVSAQTAVTTSTTTKSYNGVVTSVVPTTSVITLTSTADPAPVNYYYSKETKFYGVDGAEITMEQVSRDANIAVEYDLDGERRVLRTVRLVKPVAPTSTTTTTEETTTTTTVPKDD